MKKLIFLLIALAATIDCRSTEWVIGYYPSWRRERFPAENIDLERLTHVMHAFAWPLADGSLQHYSEFLYPELNDRVHRRGRTILLSLGGWGQSDGFSPMAADSLARRRFVEEVCRFLLSHDYDGVDLDWEFPQNAVDRRNMVLLVKELREAFDRWARPQKLWITMAVSAGDWAGQWFDYTALAPYVDFFGCMTYDFHGPWTQHAGHNSPLFPSGGDTDGSVSGGIAYLRRRGVPDEKIVLGIPFYGRLFNASRLYGPSSGGDQSFGYVQIVDLIRQGWQRYWDNTAKVPYLLNASHTQFLTYDDSLSVRLKSEYAVQQKLAGVMIWALGDDYIDGRQPLLEAAAAPILQPTRATTTESRAFSAAVFPNPFNQTAEISLNLDIAQTVVVELFDLYGRNVRRLYAGELGAGRHRLAVDGGDLPSGLYFCKLSSPRLQIIRPLTLIK